MNLLNKMPKSLSNFIKILLSSWWSTMSGAFAVPFTFLGLYNTSSQKDIFYLLAISSLIIITYKIFISHYSETPLEILFDPNENKFVKLKEEMYPKTPSYIREYSIEIKNNSTKKSIEDVIVEWEKNEHTVYFNFATQRETINDWNKLHNPITISPNSTIKIPLFSLPKNIKENSNASSKIGTFIIKVQGKDVLGQKAEFEYNPTCDIKLTKIS